MHFCAIGKNIYPSQAALKMALMNMACMDTPHHFVRYQCLHNTYMTCEYDNWGTVCQNEIINNKAYNNLVKRNDIKIFYCIYIADSLS